MNEKNALKQIETLFNVEYEDGLIVGVTCKRCKVVLYKAKVGRSDNADQVAAKMVAHFATKHSLGEIRRL